MTTTKRSKTNGVSNKGKRSSNSNSVQKSASNSGKLSSTTKHNGNTLSISMLIPNDKGSSEILEGAINDSDPRGNVVCSKQSELKSASECVFEVGDRIRVKLNAEVNHHHQDLLGKKGEVISIANTGYWVKVGYREVLFKGENLVKEGTKLSPEFEKSFASNFGRKPKAEENGQLNLLESEEDDNEAPDPDDFDNLEAFKTAWDSWAAAQFDEIEEEISHITAEEIWNQSNNGNGSICVPVSGPDSPTPGLNCGGDRPISSANATTIAETSSASDTSMPTSTEMLGTSLNVELTSSQLHHLVSLSQSMGNSSAELMKEIASPQFSQQSNSYSPDSQLLKTSGDSLAALFQESTTTNKEPIFYGCLGDLTASGTMQNGKLSVADTLEHPGIGKDSLSLRGPGALSGKDGVRPPGKNRLEHQLEKLGLIAPGEVCNPEYLESGFGLPTGFSNPSETRTALELAQVQAQQSSIAPSSELPAATEQTAIAVQPSEMLSIGEPQPLDSSELSTLQALSNELNLGSLNKQELLDKAIAQHKMIGSIEREEFNLALEKLYRVRLAGMCLQEFKRRCKHGEFEGSLENKGLKPRSAQNYMVIAKNWDLIESKAKQNALLKEGETLGLNWALEAVRDAKRSLKSAAAPPSDPDCWRTPDEIGQPILQLVKIALGIITLDPCADDAKSVKALKHFTKADDGLSQEWEGYVYMNPPFSDPLPWVQRLCFFRARGDVKGAIALLKSGCVSNKGTGELISKYASAICNWRGRIAFLNEDGEPVKGADFDCVLVYFGKDSDNFNKVFERWGTVSLLNQQVANGQLPSTANSQQLTTKNQQPTTIKEEETAAAKSLGLTNGKSILPDIRDSDRELIESHDPYTIDTLSSYQPIANNQQPAKLLEDYLIAIKSNIADFSSEQLQFLIKIADDELDRRVKE